MEFTIEKSRSAFYGEIQNKTVKLREINFKNYPIVESQDEYGYCLSFNGKRQYSQWRKNIGNKKMTDSFLQEGYELSKSKGNYFRYEDGENTVRILSSALTGFEYFNKDNKPVRSKEGFEETPTDIKDGGKVKEFWAVVIWNYATQGIQIMEITQRTVMSQIMALIGNSKWGDVRNYDLSITRTGKSLETTYAVIANPKTDLTPEVTEAYAKANVTLENLFNGQDPFQK